MSNRFETEVKRINGYLKEVVTFFDSSGRPISQVINPIMVELKPRDILQIFAGSFLVASPLSFTEEIWQLSISLNKYNVYALGLLSLVISALFIYLNFYRYRIKGHFLNFIKRILATYFISASSVILLLLLIGKFPVMETPFVALKRVIIIGFPTIFGAIISDYLK